MKTIVTLSEKETNLIYGIKKTLSLNEKFKDIQIIENNESALSELARCISLYPSILGEQHIGNTTRSINTLVDNLCIKDSLDLALHIPTKAILGQGFSVAKINFFFLLNYTIDENNFPDHEILKSELKNLIYRYVFTIMAEEVFLSIIADKRVSYHIRSNAAYLLANIWEYRIDHGVKEFTPILNNIWKAREKLKPAYGTMLGISELFKLSEDSGDVWLEFFHRDDMKHEEIDSLQEFLMGLSFEEMELLARHMDKNAKSCLTEYEINDILNENKIYPPYKTDDPREIFRSFRHRKKNANFRELADIEGPKKTIEEYLMIYLLSRPEQWSNISIN